MGLSLWAAREEIAAACATAIAVPDGLDHQQVRDHCREHYRVISRAVRVPATSCASATWPDGALALPVVGLSAVGRTFSDLGVSVSIGAGVEAALEVLSRSAATTRA